MEVWQGVMDMRKITSYTNSTGEYTRHYDEEGKLIGESWTSPAGQVKHYDADGNCVGHSFKNAHGHMTHYDRNWNKTGSSQILGSGQVRHYDADHNRTGESNQNFWHAHITDDAAPPSSQQPVSRSSGSSPNDGLSGLDALVTICFLLACVIGLIVCIFALAN